MFLRLILKNVQKNARFLFFYLITRFVKHSLVFNLSNPLTCETIIVNAIIDSNTCSFNNSSTF